MINNLLHFSHQEHFFHKELLHFDRPTNQDTGDPTDHSPKGISGSDWQGLTTVKTVFYLGTHAPNQPEPLVVEMVGLNKTQPKLCDLRLGNEGKKTVFVLHTKFVANLMLSENPVTVKPNQVYFCHIRIWTMLLQEKCHLQMSYLWSKILIFAFL